MAARLRASKSTRLGILLDKKHRADAPKSLYELRPFRGVVGDDLERGTKVFIFLRESFEEGGLFSDFHSLS